MKLIPIEQNPDSMDLGTVADEIRELLKVMPDFYEQIGFQLPWIGYLAMEDGVIVGSCSFKGAPKNNRVEIAYLTFEAYRNKGVASRMCNALVDLALSTDPEVEITARTLQENNFSTRILEKHGFRYAGDTIDEDEMPVWEWTYEK